MSGQIQDIQYQEADLETRVLLQKAMKKKENVNQIISAKIITGASNQDGYLSDLKFMNVTAQIWNGPRRKDYILVMKLGRNNNARQSSLVRNLYKREIFLYINVLPKFVQFQREKRVNRSAFDNVPTCYGTYLDEESEVIVLDDLQKDRYRMIDPKDKPIENAKLEMLLKTFGKWHAISGAMAALKHKDLPIIATQLKVALGSAQSTEQGIQLYTANMRIIYENLLNFHPLTEVETQKWRTLENRIPSILHRAIENDDRFKVVIHGDCWANNFMFKDSTPVILDWQFAAYHSPVYDISALLYSCATEEYMLSGLNKILDTYYQSFSAHMKKLGVKHPSKIYSVSDMITDWSKIGEYGVMRSFTIMKNTFSGSDIVPDIAENAENGQQFNEAFINIQIPDKNKKKLADRTLYIFKSAITHGVV